MATISGTLGNNIHRLCVGAPSVGRPDIGCPANAPLLEAGGLSVGGIVTATYFEGDGSRLTSIARSDRITSGTLAMIANGATSVVSLSTAGTVWGYLSSVMSYLPRINTERVSSTLVSSTYVQLSSATEVLSCSASRAGTLRYVSGSIQFCHNSAWKGLGGAGEYLQANRSSAQNDITAGSAVLFGSSWGNTSLVSLNTGNGRFTLLAGHTYRLMGNFRLATGSPSSAVSAQWYNVTASSGFGLSMAVQSGNLADNASDLEMAVGYITPAADTVVELRITWATTGADLSTANASIDVMMTGASDGGGGASSLADLTDVSVAGASTGSILAYNGSSWVVSSTVSASAALGDRIVSGTAVAYISPTGTVFINGRLELVTGTGVIGIGPDAARRNTGDYAVVIGSAAGEENSAGYLSALGTSAGRYNTGVRLATVGDFSAWLNTGDYVSAFGSGAAMHNQGNNVTALGAYAGWGVSGSTPAHNSTFVGYSSGVNVSGAERNTFVGAESGGNVVSGDDNILIGYQAYTPALGTNSFLNIGNAISGTMTAGGSLTFKGGVKAAGIVTATFFEGDGSRLTNLPSGGATDRIVSGTNGGTSMIAISNTGFISITQNGGVNTGWFDPTRGLVTLGVSAAGAVSGSFGYFEGMQLGSGAVAGALSSTGFLRLIGVAPYVESYGTAPLVVFRYARQTKGAPLAPNANQQVARLATSLYGSGIFGGPDDFLDVRTASDAFGGNRATSIGFYTVPRTGTLVANERMRITPEGYVGINTISPSVSLDVFGDVSASNLYVTSTLGTVSSSYAHGHYASFTTLTAGRLYGDGSGLTGVTVDASDRIVSGTTSVVTHRGNSISLSINNIERLAVTNGGITVHGNTALYPAGAGARSVHVQADTMFDGVSNVIRFRQGTSTANAVLFSFYDNTSPPLVLRNYSGVGHVGIGMMSPTAALHVSGTISATNAIQVGTSSLTCTSDIAGAIRYNGGSLELCNGTTWSALGGGGGGATDSIVSGTSHRTRVVAISTTGYISITQNNVNTAWFAPARGLSAVGVSATGAVSGSIVYGRDGLFATSLSITSGGGWTNFANGGNGILFYHSWYTPLNMAQDKVGINTWGGGGPLNWANLQVSGSMIVSSTGMGANPTLWAGTNGRVSVGIANPSYNFQVSGSIAYSGPLVDLSDRRYKTDIKALASSLEQLLALEPVSFRMKQNPGQQELGFIAQDVEKLFPDLVLTADDPSATKSLNYVGLIAPMVKGMQELKAENDHLRAKVIKLEAANDNFEARVRALEAAFR